MTDQSTGRVLPNLAQELEALRAENAALRAAASAPRHLSFKVGPSGGLSVYGLGRFPVTLYASQWRELFKAKIEIAAFLEAHKAELREKE